MQPLQSIIPSPAYTAKKVTNPVAPSNTSTFANMLSSAQQVGTSSPATAAVNANTLLENELLSSIAASSGSSDLLSSSTDPLASLLSGMNILGTSSQTPSDLAMLLTADMTGSLPTAANEPLTAISPAFVASSPATPASSIIQPAIQTQSLQPADTNPQKADMVALIGQMAPSYGLNPKLVDAVVNQESGYSPTATSSMGAMGLMQLMPSTASALGVSNPYDPVQNLQGGMTYLRDLLTRYHNDTALALAAYNAGPSAVDAYSGIPPYPETQNYVSSIMAQLSGASA